MPVYEYICLDCRKTFEIVRPISVTSPKSVTCPSCQSRHVERQWSNVFVETSRKA